ncbi:MAG: ribosome maturation factor RimM [Dongia sp.]
MILLGAIAGVHGIRGEVKVKSFTEDPMSIAAYGPLYDEQGRTFTLKLTSKGAKDSVVIARIDGIADRNAAEALKGRRLYAPRDALPAIEAEDEFYASDLIGLAVEDAAGKSYGKVADVQDYGAGPMLVIDGETSFDLPFADGFVPEVDVKAGKIVIALPEDFFTSKPVGDDASAEALAKAEDEGGD